MKTFIPVALLLALSLTACPKRQDTIAGTDEDQLEAYSARLEEMRTRAQSEQLSCGDTCKMAKDVCEIAQKVCTIAERNPDRGAQRCVSANEDCARFNDNCATCKSR